MTRPATHHLAADLRELSGPRSRLHDPAAMAAVDDYLLRAFGGSGWDARLRPFDRTGHRGVQDHGDFHLITYPRLHGVNVVATKPGATPGRVVVGAHHDTVRDSPGADDNGAGVALLLHVARLLAPRRLHRTVLLAAFDMEEIGQVGARHFVAAERTGPPITAAIIMECVGYRDRTPGTQQLPAGFGLLFPRRAATIHRRHRAADWTALIHRGDSRHVAAALRAHLRARSRGTATALTFRDPGDLPIAGAVLRAVPSVQHLTRSDHLPFWEQRIPAVLVTGTANFRNPHYHRPTDLPGIIDLDHLAHLAEATADTVAHLAGPARP